MKAKIVAERAYDSILDYAHGGGRNIQSLVFERINEDGEWELLKVTPYEDHIFVSSISPEEFDLISSPLMNIVDVPEALIEQILKAQAEQNQLNRRVMGILG